MDKINIEYRNPDDLIPYPLNAKKHPVEQINRIASSIYEFGFDQPIVIDRKGMIIKGHGRYLAALKLGLQSVPVIVVNLSDAMAKASRLADNKVSESDWDNDLLKSSIDNILESMGGSEIDLQSFGFDMSIFDDLIQSEVIESVSNSDIKTYSQSNKKENDFLIGEQPIKEGFEESKENELQEENDIEIRVKTGDIWQLGNHFILCGDCTVESNINALLGDKKATLVHADPPYGMGKEKDGVANDNLYREKLDEFQMKWIKTCRKWVKNNASCYIWGNAEDLWRLWYNGGLKDSERLTFRNQIIWDKKHGQGMLSEDFRMFPTVTEHCLFFMFGEQRFNNNADNYWEGNEPIRQYLLQERLKAGIDIPAMKTIAGHLDKSRDHWTSKSQWSFMTQDVYTSLQSYCQQNGIDAFKKEYDELKKEYAELKKEYDELKKEYYATRAYFNNTHENMTDVWEYPRVKGEERWGHATPKPVAMIERIIKSSCPENELTFEPFLGSGTTLIACEKTNRICYGTELSPKYCDVILTRYEKLTGNTAILIRNIES